MFYEVFFLSKFMIEKNWKKFQLISFRVAFGYVDDGNQIKN